MNISITSDQAKFIDNLVNQFDFGNRSELFRSVIRLLSLRPDLISQSSVMPFSEPGTRSKSEIIKSVKASNQYSPEFIRDLKKGLDDDVYFNQK